MTKGSVFTASSTRRRIFEELEKVAADPAHTTTVTLHGRPIAVFMNYDEYLRWQKTVAIAADPLLVQDLKNIQNDLEKGNLITYRELFGKPQPRLESIKKGEIVYRVRHGAQQK